MVEALGIDLNEDLLHVDLSLGAAEDQLRRYALEAVDVAEKSCRTVREPSKIRGGVLRGGLHEEVARLGGNRGAVVALYKICIGDVFSTGI